MYILIGADLVPTESNYELFKKGDVDNLVGDKLKRLLEEASYRIFNLETPLADAESPIIKCGPNLIASSSTIEGYKALEIDLLTLANNHILDQGRAGLMSTIEVLQAAGINHLGAGENLLEAEKPFCFSFDGKKVGVYACFEHEFSVAKENRAGANPFEPLWSLDHITELKSKSDFVIVLYHGGKEHYRYPSPGLQKTCRRIIDKGADLVICQHSHCIGCEEKYNNGTIIYGQGNFIFDASDDDCWQTSLLIKIDDDFLVSYIPLIKNANGVRLAEGDNYEIILSEFHQRSEEIKKPYYVEKQYQKFAESFLDYYLRVLTGKSSLLFRVLNKLSGGHYLANYLDRKYELATKVRILNYLDCEAHRELLSQALTNSYDNKLRD